MARRRSELLHYALLLFCIVMIVFAVVARHWFLLPLWLLNAGMNYKIWRTYSRRRAEAVLLKLREAAWRTRSNS